jgi:ATP adenylyltransferase
MAYVRRAAEPSGCLFCRTRRDRDDRRPLVIHRGPLAFVMLNRFPYNPGHLMVACARHAASLADLTPEEREALVEAAVLAERALAAEYRPDGVNLGANLGRVAGAGFPGHFHLHVVPRWNGDTNFMAVIAGTRVLPESLARTWSRLRRAIARLAPRAAGPRGRARAARRAARPAGGRARGRRG